MKSARLLALTITFGLIALSLIVASAITNKVGFAIPALVSVVATAFTYARFREASEKEDEEFALEIPDGDNLSKRTKLGAKNKLAGREKAFREEVVKALKEAADNGEYRAMVKFVSKDFFETIRDELAAKHYGVSFEPYAVTELKEQGIMRIQWFR